MEWIILITEWDWRYAGEKQTKCRREGTPNVSWEDLDEREEDGISSETLVESNSQ